MSNRMTVMFAATALVLAVSFGHSEEPAKTEAKTEEKKEAPKVETQAFEFGKETKHSIAMPKTWKAQENASPMRLATVSVPKAEGDKEDAELGFFALPVGGGVDKNVARWAGQFGGKDSIKSQKKIKTAEGSEATVVELEGEYTAMAFGGQKPEPKKDYKMLGAIVILKEGEYFLKLTGPQKTVNAAKDAFEAAIASFK